MNESSAVDLTGFNQLIRDLEDSLVGYGEKSDLQKTLKTEAGLLAAEISNQLGPRKKADGERNIFNDAKRSFAEITVPEVFTGSQAGIGPIRWLFGSEKLNYLVGALKEDIQPRLSKSRMREAQKKQRGVKWFEISRSIRGRRQRHVLIDRTIVAKGRIAEFVRMASKRVGRMRATFAYAAAMCGVKNIPQWVKIHFDDVTAEGRAIFDQSKLSDKKNPQIVFGGRAPGLHNFSEPIERAIHVRTMKVADKIAKIIQAYSNRQASGQSIRPVT